MTLSAGLAPIWKKVRKLERVKDMDATNPQELPFEEPSGEPPPEVNPFTEPSPVEQPPSSPDSPPAPCPPECPPEGGAGKITIEPAKHDWAVLQKT
jgi:hypothetical protein